MTGSGASRRSGGGSRSGSGGVPGYGYLSAMRKYYGVFGRAPRKEFWLFQLVSWVLLFIASVLDFYVSRNTSEDFRPFYIAVQVIHASPGVAVSIRRFHDIGLSGWYYLAFIFAMFVCGIGVLIPYILGYYILMAIAFVFFSVIWLVMLYLLVRKSQEGDNRYGRNPFAPIR